jgi:hypothetical protein
MDTESGPATLGGMAAGAYLDNAGRLFDELKLTWEQERLRGVVQNNRDDLPADHAS